MVHCRHNPIIYFYNQILNQTHSAPQELKIIFQKALDRREERINLIYAKVPASNIEKNKNNFKIERNILKSIPKHL
jgi:hypothetical protein